MNEIQKAARLEGLELSEDELTLINRQALRPLTADQVYAFRIAACDNQVDREYERFTERALEDLSKLFVGRTVLTDHHWSAGNQTARIYAGGVEAAGEVKRLVLRAYMLRGGQADDTIAAIEGGILREVSVGCVMDKAVCSVCGCDRREGYCGHAPGKGYDGQVCHIELDGARDAYEVSFVAVPAQPGAGVIKQYGGELQKGNEEAFRLAQARQDQEEKRYGGVAR